ncbi:hypothetical protein HOF92_11880, partial [bacterium]|nr:hypothetical protein [bacterium]
MQGRILYICRQNNDFERFVAIADAVNKSHTQWLFHTQALERVKNRHLAGILADRKIHLWDPGKFCLYFKSYCGLNRLARTFKSRLIWKMGQWFLSRSEQNVKSLASTILNRLNPQVVFFCYTASDAPLPLYRELHAEVRKRKIPVFIASTGIAAYATLTSSRESIIPTAQLPGDVLLSPSAQDFEEYYLPEKTMKGESFSKLVAGDPRLAKPFVLKVRDYYQSSPTLKVKPGLDQTSAVVFGSNVPYLCEGRQEPQDLIVLRIVQWLAAKNVHKIFV